MTFEFLSVTIKMQWKTILIFTILPSNLYCSWPFSSQGMVEICAVEMCDCTEPNIRCANHDFTEVNHILPDDTDVVDFSRNMVQEIDGLEKWPNSVIEINLSRNQIFQMNQNVFDTFTLLENLDLSYNKIGYINMTVLHKLTSLNSLDLSHNLLISIDPDWFGTQNNLIRLNIGYNPISKYIFYSKLLQYSKINKYSLAGVLNNLCRRFSSRL